MILNFDFDLLNVTIEGDDYKLLCAHKLMLAFKNIYQCD